MKPITIRLTTTWFPLPTPNILRTTIRDLLADEPIYFSETFCMKNVYRDNKASVHSSAAKTDERPSPCQ